MKRKTLNTRLEELFKNTNLDCYQYKGFDSAEELIESMREEIGQEDVIYYDYAIEYLTNNDSSLKKSLILAHELDYTVEKIDSALLATLLKQHNINKELDDLISDIEACFEVVSLTEQQKVKKEGRA